MIVGVDEAGRGPLAGAVVGCALYLKKKPPFIVKDSKQLQESSRHQVVSWLSDNSTFSVGIASQDEIDEINILNATFLSFDRAVNGLIQKEPKLKKATFIIDGNLYRTNTKIKYRCVIGADKSVDEVACASVVAKVFRDYLMEVAHFLYPQWNFKRHKGYPTKEHFQLLKKYNKSPIHRKSFIRSLYLS
ncbi:MAG: ribonuclease HII [Candidatus Omnitrophota bacterium]